MAGSFGLKNLMIKFWRAGRAPHPLTAKTPGRKGIPDNTRYFVHVTFAE
jgi:hypothetical protein